ncbi:class I SAM-dependent methyltransferase [Amycolatopsis kentuckyensis]|uniref:class I SAM-dependent methyltransferase n=1 Tax=Amycolatopsis kentuckyensis TaxID=218823 RepID=UPI000A368F9C|nr:class I SAM-dependent methyltransferase [Amycolatopsis kentuckyensis]
MISGSGHAAGEHAVGGADLAGLAALVDRLDAVALQAILFTLGRHGLTGVHRLDEIYAATRVAPRHRRIVRRWLRALIAEEFAVAENGRYRLSRPAGAAEVEAARAELDAAARGLEHGSGLARFFQLSVSHLPELLRDEVSLQALLFADGDLDVADDVYQRNVASRYANAAAAAVVAELARPGVRVLEIGAGVGGTSAVVLPALAGHRPDYHFTDVSRFFLSSAKERFAAHDWIRYGLFDVNGDFAAQGHPPESFDVVLAANVLHNARHVGEVLAGLRKLIAPGGALVFVDTTVEHHQLLTSMQFLMSPPATDPDADFADFRRGTDRIFPSREEWLAALRAAGFATTACLPPPGHPLGRIGQYLFVGRV